MLTMMREAGHALSFESIRAMQDRLATILPRDYVSFLLKFNGGRPVPSGFPIQGLEDNPFGSLQVFFGIGLPEVSSNIEWNYALFVDDGITHLLPIARTGCGDVLCLVLDGKSAGAVVFWDAHADAAVSVQERVYPVATDFAALVESLTEL